MLKKELNTVPTFSILINNYNYETYIHETIESVLNQSFTDFELIIVDDGSTDNSKNIINSFKDERIKTIFKKNAGQASTLNIGFKLSRGTYVSFLDSDDLFDKDKLAQVLDVFKNNNYALVQHQMRIIDKHGNTTGELFPPLKPGELDVFPLYFQQNRTNYFSATSGITVPRNISRRIFPLPEKEWKICADAPLTRLLPIFGNVYTLANPVGSYRIHGRNNWQLTREQRTQSASINMKVNRYINSFLRRSGIENQIDF